MSGLSVVIARENFGALITALKSGDREVVGPVLKDGAIMYGPIDSEADLPIGMGASLEAGTYRVGPRCDGALFGYVVGPQSLKAIFHPPRRRLFKSHTTERGITFESEPTTAPKLAVIGVRSCDLAATAVLDRVLRDSAFPNADYAARRKETVLVGVTCSEAASTCFCASTGTGPEITTGCDLILAEILSPGPHRFMVRALTPVGEALLAAVPHQVATETDAAAAQAGSARARQQMGRTLATAGLRETLLAAHDHPQWDDVAQRCLTCANCTMVCPTCFCTSVAETSDITGAHAERWQHWDSCFSLDHSYLHGGSVRTSGRSRYRQWLTHKLASWHDQFGTSGCVGCGRCIAWCPVGIDITAEVAALAVPPPLVTRLGGDR